MPGQRNDTIKADTMGALDRARTEGRLDPDIGPLLDALNALDGLVSTSSCSGRLQLIEVPEIGDKEGAVVLGKWHSVAPPEEVLQKAVRAGGSGQVLLMLQPLLLHIRCRDLSHAVKIWQTGQRAGLKFSTIRSVKLGPDGNPVPWGIVVELQGTERMEVPLRGSTDDDLRRLVPVWTEHANSLLVRTKGRMRALMELLLEGN